MNNVKVKKTIDWTGHPGKNRIVQDYLNRLNRELLIRFVARFI